MGEWMTVPNFVDNDIVHVDVFQDIWQNLYTLKNPMYAETQIETVNGPWTTSSSGFTDIDTTYFRIIFESYGNDIIAGLLIKHRGDVVNGSTQFRYELDGVTQGNARGQMVFQLYASAIDDTAQLLYVFANVAAGVHTLDVQYARITNALVTVGPIAGESYKLWVKEF